MLDFKQLFDTCVSLTFLWRIPVYITFYLKGFLDLKLMPWIRNFLTRSLAIVPSLIVAIIGGPSGAGKLIIISSVRYILPVLEYTSYFICLRFNALPPPSKFLAIVQLLCADQLQLKIEGQCILTPCNLLFRQMILSFELPFALIPLLKFTSSKTKMGPHVNSLAVISTNPRSFSITLVFFFPFC